MNDDPSQGYEAIAGHFVESRSPTIGVEPTRAWARDLTTGADVLELGCGHGVPISQTLLESGLKLHVVDASPTLLAAFRQRFPDVPAECGPAETSPLFNRRFRGVIAWGLMFLLPVPRQELLIRRVAALLETGGRFLFTSPKQACSWNDLMTGQISQSHGYAEYLRLAEAAGLELASTGEDEGGNFYYSFVRTG